MYKQGAANLGNVPQAPALKRLYQKKSNLINSYIYMEKSSPKKFLLIVIPIFPYQRTGSNMKRNSLSYQIIFKTIKF